MPLEKSSAPQRSLWCSACRETVHWRSTLVGPPPVDSYFTHWRYFTTVCFHFCPSSTFKGSITPVSNRHLQAVTNDIKDIRRNQSVVFMVTSPPKLGRLVRRLPDNSTQNVSMFTQSMVGVTSAPERSRACPSSRLNLAASGEPRRHPVPSERGGVSGLVGRRRLLLHGVLAPRGPSSTHLHHPHFLPGQRTPEQPSEEQTAEQRRFCCRTQTRVRIFPAFW